MTGGVLVLARADASGAGRLFGDLLPWLGLLVVIILVGGGVAVWLRRRLMAQDSAGSLGFTLGDLREMRARGEISDAEFEAAKSQMIAGFTRPDPASDTALIDGSESVVQGRVPARRNADGSPGSSGSSSRPGGEPESASGDESGDGNSSGDSPRSAAEDGNG